MISLLLLKGDNGNVDQLKAIFNNAGYQVTFDTEIAASFGDLVGEVPCLTGEGAGGASSPQAPPGAYPLPYRGETNNSITVFTTIDREQDLHEIAAMPALKEYIVLSAKPLTNGWRLSLRSRTLAAPNGLCSRLTSLEFSFIKIFALVDVGEAVSRKKIVMEFGEDYLSYDQNRLDTMVTRLRKKIEAEAQMQIPLHTVRVRGFSFGDVLILDM